jgi:hypothetical protein
MKRLLLTAAALAALTVPAAATCATFGPDKIMPTDYFKSLLAKPQPPAWRIANTRGLADAALCERDEISYEEFLRRIADAGDRAIRQIQSLTPPPPTFDCTPDGWGGFSCM